MSKIGGTGVYTKLLIEKMVEEKHTIGLWPADSLVFKDLEKMDIVRYSIMTKMISTEWDILVIQNALTLTAASHLLHQLKGIPNIFISHSSLNIDQISPYPDLFKVVSIAKTISNSWGIPDEMVRVIFNPHVIPKYNSYKRRRHGPYKILHVSRLDPDRTNTVRDIITVFNNLAECHLTIVGGGWDYMLKKCANNNISFVGEQADVSAYYKETDLVIGSGRVAVEALSYCKPVIVAGIRGLGGLVKPENYERFKGIMFSGRFDGILQEKISSELLKNEIVTTLSNNRLQEIVNNNYALVKEDYNIQHIIPEMVSLFNDVTNINKQLSDFNTFTQLKPRLASNCKFYKNGKSDTYQIRRHPIGKILGQINREGKEMLECFNGKNSIDDIAFSFAYNNKKDLVDLSAGLRELWNEKILIF